MEARQKFRFSIRQLLATILVLSMLIVIAPRLYRFMIGYSSVDSVSQLPEELAALVDDQTKISGFRWTTYSFNRRSILRIENDENSIRNIIAANSLQRCDQSHLVVARMINTIPKGWQKPDPAEGRWYTTAGFGQSNVEGVNEYLIHTTEDHQSAIIYHERDF